MFFKKAIEAKGKIDQHKTEEGGKDRGPREKARSRTTPTPFPGAMKKKTARHKKGCEPLQGVRTERGLTKKN